MKSSESEEMYLETILVLKKRNAYVRSVDIAEELNYSRPSICRAVGVLQKKGYILMNSNGEISFTDDGRKKAESIYERHCVLTELLIKTGASEQIAEENACRMEHVITDELLEILKEYLKKC